MNYILHIAVNLLLYVLLASSLNILVGYTGRMSMAHAAFFGIGAYSTALLMLKTGLGLPLALLASAAVALVVSLVVALPSLHLKGDYFLLASLAFQFVVFSAMKNLDGLTGGPMGLPAIPRPTIFGLEVDTPLRYLLCYGVFAVLLLLAMVAMLKSRFGLSLRAIRDDETAALSQGINTYACKTVAFAVACSIAAVVGGLFASFYTFVDPTSFGLPESIFILCAVLIGGSGNIKGPLIGAAVVVLLPELLRFLNVPSEMAANVRQIVYGACLVGLMRFRPQGIAGEYALDK